MAQPATNSPAAFVPAPFDAFDPATHRAEGPANRALAELALALSEEAYADTGPKWSPAQTLRFILLSCGGFWLAAAALYFTIR